MGYFVAGIAEARQKSGVGWTSGKHDRTVMTIANLIMNELDLPIVQIVHQIEWNGKPYTEQYAQFVEQCERWKIHRVVIDASGLGGIPVSSLSARLGEDRVVPFHFSPQSKTELFYHMLNLIDTGRLKMYKDEGAPDNIRTEAWKQLNLAMYRVSDDNLLDVYVDTEDGRDDYLMSIALCSEAVRNWPGPMYIGILSISNDDQRLRTANRGRRDRSACLWRKSHRPDRASPVRGAASVPCTDPIDRCPYE